MMYPYLVYGMTIYSEFPLPGLQTGTGASVNINISRGNLDRFTRTLSRPDDWAGPDTETLGRKFDLLEFEGVGKFLISDGHQVTIDPASSSLNPSVLSLFILKYVLPILLHRQGQLILHGNAVSIFHRAAIFLGGSGSGKSTTAAAMHQHGHHTVADDVVVIDDCDGGLHTVFSGLPNLLLWPETVNYLGYDLDELSQPVCNFEKYELRTGSSLPPAPIPLDRIYILAEDAAARIERLSPRDALDWLLRSSYYGIWSKRAEITHLLFRRCVSLIDSVPVCYLRRPKILSALPEVIRLVEEDLA